MSKVPVLIFCRYKRSYDSRSRLAIVVILDKISFTLKVRLFLIKLRFEKDARMSGPHLASIFPKLQFFEQIVSKICGNVF